MKAADDIDADIPKLCAAAAFYIGGADQTKELKDEVASLSTDDDPNVKRIEARWLQFLKETQIKIGTLLKSDSVSFLIGAGASKDVGGLLLGSIPLEIEKQLLAEGTAGGRVRTWLKVFYSALRHLAITPEGIPQNRESILNRKTLVEEDLAKPELQRNQKIPINYEAVLSLLYRWRSALMPKGSRLRIDGTPPIDLRRHDLDECLSRAKRALARQCELPKFPGNSDALASHTSFVKKILTRPLNLKRINVFTSNYDTLIEQAADAEGVVLVDGFIGTIRRVFRPESYDHDLYFPAETTEGRVHRSDRVIHLYKFHGSINWCASEPSWNNPYGVSVQSDVDEFVEALLIYPTPTKFGDTLGMPYSELFRRFAWTVVRPQSTLFVIGYSFGDEHINAIVRQALAVPSFTLVIVDPFVSDPDQSSQTFVARLRAEKDQRVWILAGFPLGSFAGFVKRVLPDLRDEEIAAKITSTYRALSARSDLKQSGAA